MRARGRRCFLHAATLEVAEELDRTQKDPKTVRAMIWPRQQPKKFQTVGQQTRPRASNFASFSGKFATDVLLIKELRRRKKKTLHRTFKIKRKAWEVVESLSTHQERTPRKTNERARVEGHVNNGIGSLGRAVQAAAKATHSLTCGVPDRESNKIKYLR